MADEGDSTKKPNAGGPRSGAAPRSTPPPPPVRSSRAATAGPAKVSAPPKVSVPPAPVRSKEPPPPPTRSKAPPAVPPTADGVAPDEAKSAPGASARKFPSRPPVMPARAPQQPAAVAKLEKIPSAPSASAAPVPLPLPPARHTVSDRKPIDATTMIRPVLQVKPPAESEAARAEDFLKKAVLELPTKTHPAMRARIQFECGRLCEAVLGRADDAIGHYRKALVENPSHVPSIRSLRRLLLSKGEYGSTV